MRARRVPVVLALAVVMASAVACGSPAGDDAAEPTPGGARPSSPAELTILHPEPGAVVEGPNLTVQLQLVNAVIIEETTTNIRPDEGHVHVSVDGRVVSLLAGLEYELTDLQPGLHVLEVEFVAGDHAPFNPRISQQSTFTVQ